MKVRDQLRSYDENPGWYKHPPGTVALKANDDALLEKVAVGLGTVATAALALSAVSANYRIANAQTSIANAMRLQAQQAQAPIVCNYTLPARYGTTGYIYCR